MSHEGAVGEPPPPLVVPVARTLTGPRVTLRRFEEGDVTELGDAIARSADHLRPFMAWIGAEPLSATSRAELIAAWNREADAGGGATLGCFVDGALIGSAGLHRRRPDAAALEVGYWLRTTALGQGYATELTLLLAEEAFSHDEISRVDLYCDLRNEPSAQVAIRAGFTLLEVAPDPRGLIAEASSGSERHFRLERAAFDPAWRARF